MESSETELVGCAPVRQGPPRGPLPIQKGFLVRLKPGELTFHRKHKRDQIGRVTSVKQSQHKNLTWAWVLWPDKKFQVYSVDFLEPIVTHRLPDGTIGVAIDSAK